MTTRITDYKHVEAGGTPCSIGPKNLCEATACIWTAMKNR